MRQHPVRCSNHCLARPVSRPFRSNPETPQQRIYAKLNSCRLLDNRVIRHCDGERNRCWCGRRNDLEIERIQTIFDDVCNSFHSCHSGSINLLGCDFPWDHHSGQHSFPIWHRSRGARRGLVQTNCRPGACVPVRSQGRWATSFHSMDDASRRTQRRGRLCAWDRTANRSILVSGHRLLFIICRLSFLTQASSQ